MRSIPERRLGLGTAQFGLAYGATNVRGRVSIREARRIIGLAREAGIHVLDTAAAYGESEGVLGSLAEEVKDFRIVTKTIPIASQTITTVETKQVTDALNASRRHLKRPMLDAVLVHHGKTLLHPGGERIVESLSEEKTRGTISKIGVSVYDPTELESIIPMFVPDIVQFPVNLLDQRFPQSGALSRLKAAGTELHARSLFLQGTLLVSPRELPPALAAGHSKYARVADFAAVNKLSPLVACLSYGFSIQEIDCMILGVTGVDELMAILTALRDLPHRVPDMSALAVADLNIIDPSRWRI